MCDYCRWAIGMLEDGILTWREAMGAQEPGLLVLHRSGCSSFRPPGYRGTATLDQVVRTEGIPGIMAPLVEQGRLPSDLVVAAMRKVFWDADEARLGLAPRQARAAS